MKILRNYIYNASYQLLTIVLPILTVPIVSKALGSQGVGIYAYTNSIVQEIALIGTLGISNYAVRQIAYARDSSSKLSYEFCGIFCFQLLFSSFSLIIFIVFALWGDSKYLSIFLIQSLFIASAAIDVSWFFTGIEDFKKIVTRNSAVKIVGLILVILLVKSKNDIFLYVLILSVTQFLGQVTMLGYVHSYVKWRRPNVKRILTMLVPIMTMFIPQIATQIYTVLNKTLLGVMKSKSEVGYFDMSDKISRIILQLLIAIAAVMYPKISNLYAQHKHDLIEKYLNLTIQIVNVVAIPMTFGLISVSEWFVPWFLGEQFIPANPVLAIMSLLLWLVPFCTILENQFLLPTRHVNLVTIAFCGGAVVSLITNVLLIPKFAAIGAAIASVLAESTALLISLYFISHYISIKKLFSHVPIYLINSLIMFIFIRWIGITMAHATLTTTLVQGVTGSLVYVFLTLVTVKWVREYLKMFIGHICKT